MGILVITGDYADIVADPSIVPESIEAVVIWTPGVTSEDDALHYATQPLTNFNGYNYDSRLKRISAISSQLGNGLQRITFSLHNADLAERANFALRSGVGTGPSYYIGSRIKIYRILRTSTLFGYAVPFEGVVTGLRYNDQTVDLDATAYVNRAPVISNRRVGRKCGWEFKGTECGYSGALTTCNKLFSDSGGCSGRSNTHRYGGFPSRSDIASLGTLSGLGRSPEYQLVQIGANFTAQRPTLKFDDTFSVTDDDVNAATIVSSITPDWINVKSITYNAAGSIALTTGSITAASTSLSVVDSSTWEVGHGIRVSGAGAIAGTSTLNGSINSSVTTITLVSTANFAPKGKVKIDNEVIYYSAKTSTQLTGCVRAYEGTNLASHSNGATVTPQVDLITTVSAISGTIFTLAASASTSVSNALITHDDNQAFVDAIFDAASLGRPLYVPAGDYYAGPLQIDSPDGLIILGDSPGKTTLYSRDPETILEIDANTAPTNRVIIRDLGFYGSGDGVNNYGIRFRNTGANTISAIRLENLRVENCGNAGICTDSVITSLAIEGVEVSQYSSCFGSAIDVYGGNDITLTNCYVRNVAYQKSGYRIRSGVVTLIGCTGMDSSLISTWGIFGNVTAEDGEDSSVRAALIGCNVSGFDSIGIRCKDGSSASFYGVTISPASSATCVALQFDGVSDDQSGIFDANSSIIPGSATFIYGYAVHSSGVPFIQIGHRDIADYYDLTQAAAVSLPSLKAGDYGTGAIKPLTSTGYTRINGHLILDEKSSPGSPASNTGFLYAKDDAGVTGLYWKADGVSEVRIDTGGGGGGITGLTVGATTITSGTSGNVLYNNAGVLGEYATTGSGNVVRATSPTITTPTIAKLANLTSNGFVKTSGGDGTLSVDTNAYLTSVNLATNVTGVLPIANGGTNASTASNARINLLPSYTSNGGKVLAVNTGATDVEWITASGGGSGLTNDNETITADYTATVNTRYFLTIGSMGANRNFTLPTPAIGDRIEVSILDGNSTNELIIKGASGVKINKGTAATEWSRLFIAGETVTFVADATDNWQVLVDGRIPCKAYATSPGYELPGFTSSATTDLVTFSSAHGLSTGTPIYFKGSTPPLGTVVNDRTDTYFAIVSTTTAIYIATTYERALTSTYEQLNTTTGSGMTAYKSVLWLHNTMQALELNVTVVDNASMIDATNKRFKIRRNGTYNLAYGLQWSDQSTTAHLFQGIWTSSNASIGQTDILLSAPFETIQNLYSTVRPSLLVPGFFSFSAGKFLYAICRQQKNIGQSIHHKNSDTYASVVEVL